MHETVFLIGAGASAEVGLPTGERLKQLISDSLDIEYNSIGDVSKGDRLIDGSIREKCSEISDALLYHKEMSEYKNIFKKTRNLLHLSPSIDNFIDSNRGDKRISLCGKLAILQKILESERQSKLYFDNRTGKGLSYDVIQNTWYQKYFHLITEGSDKNEAREKILKSSFIIFNYDRCFEHFMYNALKDFYSLSDDEAVEFMDAMNIIHPYGKVGELQYSRKGDAVNFGANIGNSKFFLSLSASIKTFTESVDEEKVVNNINKLIHNAERLIFLGFAFHPINMSLFRPKDANHNNRMVPRCYFTSYQLSDFNIENIRGKIARLFNVSTLQLPYNQEYFNSCSCKCTDLFDHFKSALYF